MPGPISDAHRLSRPGTMPLMGRTDSDKDSAAIGGGVRFATTRWSLVSKMQGDDRSEARAALSELCQTYWFPIYAHLRRTGRSRHEAEDLTQGFFTRLLERERWDHVEPEKGRFRSFLLAALKHFVINEWHKARAVKRGGGRPLLSLDFDTAETRYQRIPRQLGSPEQLFERQWALTLLAHVRSILEQEYAAGGKAELFRRLEDHLVADPQASRYGEIARDLHMTEGAIKVAVHRLRQRFRDRLRAEIAQTVASQDDIDDEIRNLFDALRR